MRPTTSDNETARMNDDLVIYPCRPGCQQCKRQAELAYAAAYLEVLTRP